MSDVQVIGGGFSGLAAAYFLNRENHRVRIVETGPRVGGLLETLQTPYGPYETAANAMIANAVVEEVAADLGLQLVPALSTAKRRYILREKNLRRWPINLSASLRLLSLALPFPLGKASPLAPRQRESLRAWGERALGRETTEYLLAPVLSGIYAGNPEQLSASLTVGRFFHSRRERKIPRGKLRGSVAPEKGMGAWAPAFRHVLESNHCTFARDPIPGLPTVVALPPPAAVKFLENKTPALVAELRKIRMVPIASVTVFFPPETSGIPGFGCLFPKKEGFRALGVLANDRIFPKRAFEAISETWLFGGALDPEISKLSDQELVQLVLNERARLHGLRPRALLTKVTRWEQAFPHYDLALEGALENLRALRFREGIYRLFGTYLGDLGLGTVLYRASQISRDFL